LLSILSAIQIPGRTGKHETSDLHLRGQVLYKSVNEMKDGPIQATIAVVKALWLFIGDVVASAELQLDERDLCDSDLIGELNHRTGRLDAGHDPQGWYDQDWGD